MIDKLFTYTECDEIDQLVIVYENIELVCSIGEFPHGSFFDFATIDYQKGLLTLNWDGQESKYPLTLQVGELLT